uniref:Prolylcarboxypeptidase n=1 Tax=Equus asinus TaxID=9793 RepID=A0A9L0JVN4_EQUAS
MERRALLLLLLAFLTPGAPIPVPPALKALSNLHLSTRLTSRPAIDIKYSIHYIQQKVDHFGFDTDKTFKQRYLIADKHWKKDGGSILFYTGNEGDITWFCNNTVVCQYLKNPNVSDPQLLQNIFQALNVYYNYSGQVKCLNMSETATRSLGSLGWSYQACTEMVMPFCTNGIDDMFEPHSWNLKEFSDDCFKQWGVRPRPSWITTMYGGKNISSHTNIIFSNGDLDPWSGGGVTENVTDTLVAITIPEGAHHLDLRANNAFDPTSVLLARSLEVRYMKQWIKNFYASLRKKR